MYCILFMFSLYCLRSFLAHQLIMLFCFSFVFCLSIYDDHFTISANEELGDDTFMM